jgi:DNA polymerase-3 subunit gamma/tau
MVRFLRNTTVAKIAGKDSALLQVSSEERERVARVAEWFGEEDLTRHLQIMLRTHGELGYKQEQRFHLELGLLKMAHAQKLLPIEQLLSSVSTAAPAAIAPRSPARPSIVGSAVGTDPRRSEPASAPRQNFVSPFAADSARKGTPRQEATTTPDPAPGPRIAAVANQPEPVIMGAAVPAPRRDIAPMTSAVQVSAREPQPQAEPEALPVLNAPVDQIQNLQNAVLQALTDGNQRILVSMLSAGEWSVQGNELIIKIAESQTVLDMSLGPDAKRLAIASASGLLGRPVKLKVVPGATVSPQENNRNSGPPSSGPAGRGRAEQDPVVRRMQEKFGAQVRAVIDYREKR